jgi:3-phenylpropionate/trans-cinnamate dioxygenase ferredoxin reductase subunit
MTRYLIIGCGAAGTSAAETIRQADAAAEITLISHERIRAVARPRLVDYASGTIPLAELETREPAWFDEMHLDLHLETAAEAVDPARHEVRLLGGEVLPYDKLLIAVGITPSPIPFAGGDLKGSCHMHYLPQADEVRAAVESTEHAVVVGGGLVGQDISGALRRAGRKVTLLVRGDVVGVPQFDERSGRLVGEELRGLGVDVRLRTEVARIEGSGGRVNKIVTTGGEEIACQLAFTAIGAAPNVAWLKPSGIPLGRGVVVDDRLASVTPDVFAAGSCAEIHMDDKVLTQASWGNALAQGKTAALNMLGGAERYNTPSDYIAKVGNARFTLFGSPANAFPKARFVGFAGPDGSYAALLAEGGLVRGGVLVGKHLRARDIKALQLRAAPVPGLAELSGEQQVSLSDFIAGALGLQ